VTELQQRSDRVAGVRVRPSVHFTATEGWINDPYGITWDGEQYHLFYQAIPGRVTWAPNCHWGHAVSPDLVRWTELPLALVPAPDEVGCWSGSAVLDQSPAVLLYTRVAGEDWGQGQVAIARPTPDGSSWDTAAADVLIAGPPAELGAHAFRDPYVWRTDDGWNMLMAAGLPDGSGAALQYRSADLMTWEYQGILAQRNGSEQDGAWTGKLWECPQLFPLGDAWVLLVSVWNDDVLCYVAGAIGDYDGARFVPCSWQRLTYGSSAYAMSAFTDRDGRWCVLSWPREEPQNDPPWSASRGHIPSPPPWTSSTGGSCSRRTRTGSGCGHRSQSSVIRCSPTPRCTSRPRWNRGTDCAWPRTVSCG
jgi:beta-fructofuranosidase